MNGTRFKRTYTDNRLKRFKTRDVEDSSMEQIEIHEMLNIALEDSIDAMKKSNNINKNVRINDEVRNEVVRDIAESLNADSQVFKNDVINDNLLNSKIRNIHARVNFSTRCFNRLIEIENSLNNVGRSINTAAFVTINEISIKKNKVR